MPSVQKRVLVRPSFHDWCQNKLFSKGTSYEGIYRSAFSRWRELALAQCFTIDTWDLHPLESADVLWFLDLPPTRREFEAIRAKLKPGAKLVLQILETPALGWHAFRPENSSDFDAVVTYQHPETLAGRKNCHHYRLPNTLRAAPSNRPFSERKGLLFLNTNRVEGWWAMRQPGWAGLPMLGKLLAGWKCSLGDLREYSRRELYAARRALLREAERIAPDLVDLFGRGWNGEQVSWCPLYPNRPYRCWRGLAPCPKDELAAQYRFVGAFENFRGTLGYISEKLFDALFAGSVPVYLGEERITEFVPADCFVDARHFKTHRELLTYLRDCPEAEWQRMREAGQQFLRSDKIKPFTDEAFAQRMMEVLHRVLGPCPQPAP